MSGDLLHQLIQRELDELDKMMCRYAEAIRLGSAIEPELLQVTALGSVLHSFYSGIERIFAEVAKRIDRSLPQGDRWHTELLIQIARPTASRPAVISDATQRLLRRYLAFRHYYRHSYSHLLAWSRLQELIADLTDVWQNVRTDLYRFLASCPHTEGSAPHPTCD